jgi:polyisoprenoid-binding protein YceI
MKNVLALALLLSVPLAQAAPIDAAQSRIGFTMKQENAPVDGSFKTFSGTVVLDLAHPAAGHADIVINTGSIALPTREAENETHKKDWFNSSQIPTARFTTTSIKSLGGNRYQFAGKLTLKGITRDVSAPFTAQKQGALTVVDGVLPISRLAFKIGEGDWSDTSTVADEVRIKFHVAVHG